MASWAEREPEINQRLDKWLSAAEGPDFNIRRREYADIRDFQMGRHWVDHGLSDERSLPALQLTWLACEQQLPKVFTGYDFKPKCVPEQNKNYEVDGDSGVRRALRETSEQVDGKTDAEREAELRSAILDYEWDQGLLARFKEGAQMAQWYGDAFFLDGMDEDGVFLDVVHPDDVRVDPQARRLDEARFVCYIVWRTLGYVKGTYKRGKEIKVDTDDKSWSARREMSQETDVDEDSRLVPLECWFERVDESRTEYERETTDDPQRAVQLQDEGWELEDTVTGPTEINGQTIEAPVSWTLRKGEKVEKYPGGWRKVIRCCGTVLEEGENPSANGKLPLHHLRWYNVPGEFWGVGLPRQIKSLNSQLDEMAYSGTEIIQTLRPFMLALQGRISLRAMDAISEGMPVPVVYAKPDVGVDDSTEIDKLVRQIPGAELPASFMAMMQQYQGWIEQISGSYDLRNQNNLPQDASGKFVEAVESSGNARISQIRENLREVVKSVSRNVLANVIAYTEGEESYRVEKSGVGTQYISFRPNDLDDDFERDFDIVIGGVDSLPQNPIDRAQYLIGLMDSLAQKPPHLAFAQLDMLEIPNKDGVRRALQQHYDEMQKQQKEGPQVDPDTAQKYAEGVSDIMENLAKSVSDTDPGFAVLVAMALQDAKKTGDVNFESLKQVAMAATQANQVANAQAQAQALMGQPGMSPGQQQGVM